MSANARPLPPGFPNRRAAGSAAAREAVPQTEEERLRLARERAQKYGSPDEKPRSGPGRRTADDLLLDDELIGEEEEVPQTLDEWQDLVSRRVDEAVRQGMFENLPGQGKPQPISNDPFVPEDRRMAYNLMKKNQITPGWIGDRKAILGAIDALRAEIREIGTLYWGKAEQPMSQPRREQLAHEWNFFVKEWDERVKLMNKQILNLNLSQPYHHLEVYQLRLHEELKRAGVERTLFA